MKSVMGWVLLVAAFLAAGASEAAVVNYHLKVNEGGPGTYNLYVSSSLGDNFGLAFYSANLLGGISTLDHKSPRALELDSGDPIGFRTLRSADNNVARLVEAAQDTITPTPFLVRGLGQTPGNLGTLPGVTGLLSTEQVVYGAPLLLASGLYAGPASALGIASGSLANVFQAAGGIATMAAQTSTQVTVVPEPATLGASVLALAALVVGRRRSR